MTLTDSTRHVPSELSNSARARASSPFVVTEAVRKPSTTAASFTTGGSDCATAAAGNTTSRQRSERSETTFRCNADQQFPCS